MGVVLYEFAAGYLRRYLCLANRTIKQSALVEALDMKILHLVDYTLHCLSSLQPRCMSMDCSGDEDGTKTLSRTQYGSTVLKSTADVSGDRVSEFTVTFN